MGLVVRVGVRVEGARTRVREMDLFGHYEATRSGWRCPETCGRPWPSCGPHNGGYYLATRLWSGKSRVSGHSKDHIQQGLYTARTIYMKDHIMLSMTGFGIEASE